MKVTIAIRGLFGLAIGDVDFGILSLDVNWKIMKKATTMMTHSAPPLGKREFRYEAIIWIRYREDGKPHWMHLSCVEPQSVKGGKMRRGCLQAPLEIRRVRVVLCGAAERLAQPRLLGPREPYARVQTESMVTLPRWL